MPHPLLDLLERWEVAYEQGRELSPRELTADEQQAAELSVAIRRLQALAWLRQPPLGEDTSAGASDRTSEGTSPLLPHLPLLRAAFDTGVLSPDEVERWRRVAQQHDADGAWLAQRLVAERAITPYQAQALCEGHLARLRWGKYVVLEPLAQGTRGEAFRARDVESGQIVVLKLLSAAATRAHEGLARLQADIVELKRLAHPGIARPLELGDCWGQPFVATEFVEGQSLAELVRARGALPWRAAARYASQAAEALTAAHERGVLHGGIKPAHLLVAADDTIRLIDFGLFRAHELRWDAGQGSGDRIDFLAPEAAFARGELDHRADLYSLGCVLYFLVTGQGLFAGGVANQRLLRHRDEPPPALRTRCPTAPRALDVLLSSMLAKRPADRVASMEVVAARLSRIAAPGGMMARLTGLFAR